MKIHFRDVQTGMVEARAVIEIEEGVFLNEVTILNIDGELVVEFPRKNFMGKNDRQHHLDIITFENEDKQVLWELQIKTAYRDWRKENRKVLIYEDKPRDDSESEAQPRKPYRERSYDDKPRGERSYGDRKPREYSDRDSRPYGNKPSYRDKPAGDRRSQSDRPRSERSYDDRKPREYSDRDSRPRSGSRSYGDKPAYSDKPRRENRSYEDKPRREYAPRQDKPAYDKPSRERKEYSDKPKRVYKKTAGSGKTRSASAAGPKTRRPKK